VIAWNSDYAIGHWRNVFICIPKKSNLKGVGLLRKGLERLARTSGTGVGLVVIIEPDADSPVSEERKQFAAINRDTPGLKGVAVVFEGRGFKASAVRSVAAGIAFLSRSPIPHKVFSVLPEAAAWIGPLVHNAGSLPAGGLLRAIDLIRCDPEQLPHDARVFYAYANSTS
jgi:hypothetical protein